MQAEEPRAPRPEGIPEEPEGTRVHADTDEGQPVGPTPACDFWSAIYQRRSIRKFKPDPVPRELVEQVLHAGIWAPSSCNYQMWDFVAVDDPAVNQRLAGLSSQMGNAPVNIIVAYGRDFSEEAWANIQSASAAIENMSLAAHVLGLGTFWITQTGDRERVREIVGLPEDRLVIAVLALGYPRLQPKKGPKRRPLREVAHWNHYTGRAIPASVRPQDWAPDLLRTYQRARVLNGLRHNKPRPWEQRALGEALDRLLPEKNPGKPVDSAGNPPRWLDVLPCTGILTERLARDRQGYAFEVLERSPEVAEFCANRAIPRARVLLWDCEKPQLPGGRYARISCLYRLENLHAAERAALMRELAEALAPDGELLIGFVNARSFHNAMEWLRGRRGGPRGVEYVLSPDPSIGPFEALEPAAMEQLARANGLRVVARHGTQAAPPAEELAFRTRNFGARARAVAGALAGAARILDWIPGVPARWGRFQYLLLKRA
jgi:nitroreductase/SAM-dependent methyltransferase